MRPCLLAFRVLLLVFFCVASQGAVDLAISIDTPLGPIPLSSNLIYTITVTNQSANRATGVVMIDQLAETVNFISATTSQGSCAHSDGEVICNLGNLNAGAAVNITIRCQPTAELWVDTRADVSAIQDDSAPENNTVWAQTLIGLMDLELTLNAPPQSVMAGRTVRYTLTVTNHGPDPTPGGSGVELRLESLGPENHIIATNISAGTFESAGYYYAWFFPALAPAASVMLELEIWLISEPTFSFYASTLGGPNDTNASNNTVSHYLTIQSGPGILQFARTSQDALESGGSAQIQINRVGGAIGTVQAGFATEDGTATAGDDYSGVNATVTFAPGETTKLIPVSLFRHSQFECARDFKARLFSPSGGAILGPRTNTTITLFDDDVLPQGTTECISVTYSNSWFAARGDPIFFSEDGRYVLFWSAGGNWQTNDDNPYNGQIFLRDTLTGSTRLVSVNYQGTGASAGHPDEADAVMSGNGRYVVFSSDGQDLTTNSIGWRDVFVRDLLADRTRLVSITPDGTSGGNGYSAAPLISSNGTTIVFVSSATDLVPNCQCEGHANIFARNLRSGLTYLVTRSASGPANGDSSLAGLSADGRFMLFWSDATSLVAGDTNGETDVFVHDLVTQTTSLVSMNAAGTGSGKASSYPQALPRITPDGRFVVFDSAASDLVAGDNNGTRDVFIRDLSLETTRLVSVNQAGTGPGNGYSAGSSVTRDGRYVAFYSDATDLVSATYLRPNNIFVRDLQNNMTALASLNCNGDAAGSCTIPTIAGNGRYVAFTSFARDLVSGAFPFSSSGIAIEHIYRRDLVLGVTTLVTANYDYTGGGNEAAREPMISVDGKSILFIDVASDLTGATDINTGVDVFLWRELPPGANADVRVTSSVNPLRSGMVISLRVTNFGPDIATSVVVQDTLSAGVTFISAETTVGSCTLSAGEVTCALGSLARRAGAVITLVVTPIANGAATHTATVSHGINDPLSANDTLNDSNTLILPPSATLWISHCKPNVFVQWLSAPPEFQIESGVLNGWAPGPNGILDNSVLKTLIVPDDGASAQFYRLHRP